MSEYDRDLMVAKIRISDHANEMGHVLGDKIRRLGGEAHAAGKNLAVGPIDSHMDTRPNIVGHFCKFRFDYAFITPGDPCPAGWELFNTAEIDPMMPLG